ncbi:aminoacyl-tRNA hydrolase [Cerasicoccus arenae]|uniref:Peptidyl-tRNA hydrolase n=1 Tax=Cerasicoccus arenae TaxID=424488 RepID=A0A8J3GEJ0_9BACT|nr:aminoacyl-tRNA hydrolase [Cerasicoccus arenae]MBK1856724.1 aminoacyl-tRNA hydrolase [Cerasicoccus arenae]GHB99143.1 peptidyl-tRNA hydrolase [Cerasicoccus arenae]
MAVSVIAGLGNPGLEYRDTRHNVGFQVVDQLAVACRAEWKLQKRLQAKMAKVTIAGQSIILVKPETYMNESGVALGAVMRYLKVPVETIVVIYDEINLELGRCKITINGSAGGHNGVASLLKHMGSGFVRYRIGIGGNPHRGDLINWVLGKFTNEENIHIQSQFPEYIDGLRLLAEQGTTIAMNRINTRISPPSNHEPDSNN